MLHTGPLDLPPAWWTDWNHRVEDERCGGWLPALHAYVAQAIGRLCFAGIISHQHHRGQMSSCR